MPIARCNGIDLHYEIHGAGEPLLLIHGLGSSGRDWEFQTAEFSQLYQVILPDLRGHGRSHKPRGPYSMSIYATDIACLLQTLGIRGAHTVGWSLGGAVAFQLALDHPTTIKTLTITNSMPEVVPRTWLERFAVWHRLAEARFLGIRRAAHSLSKTFFVRPEQEDLRRKFVTRWLENDERSYLEGLRAIVGWSVTHRLGELRCPTLVLAADQDYTSVGFKQSYTAKIANARLVIIPDSRHALPAEKPDEFNRVLRAFLCENGRLAGARSEGTLANP